MRLSLGLSLGPLLLCRGDFAASPSSLSVTGALQGSQEAVWAVGDPSLKLGPLGELDDEAVLRMLQVLRQNVRQWSFVETQLMEPRVNLAMVARLVRPPLTQSPRSRRSSFP